MAESRTFISGVLDIATVQAADPVALVAPVCEDRSRFAGSGNAAGVPLAVRGVVTARFGRVHYLESAGGGPRSGMSALLRHCSLVIGHRYVLAGSVREADGETQLTNVSYATDEGPDAVPAPITQTAAVLADDACTPAPGPYGAEDFEGVLVQVKYGRVPSDDCPGGNFYLSDLPPADSRFVVVDKAGGFAFDPEPDATVSVTGVMRAVRGELRLAPRGDGDIRFHGINVSVPQASTPANALEITPNPGVRFDVRFSLGHKGMVLLAIYDLAGRRIATLADGTFEAGPHTLGWNGRGPDGRYARAGVYFCQLRIGGVVGVRRVILLP
jgi:hypothetical protein